MKKHCLSGGQALVTGQRLHRNQVGEAACVLSAVPSGGIGDSGKWEFLKDFDVVKRYGCLYFRRIQEKV